MHLINPRVATKIKRAPCPPSRSIVAHIALYYFLPRSPLILDHNKASPNFYVIRGVRECRGKSRNDDDGAGLGVAKIGIGAVANDFFDVQRAADDGSGTICQ